MIATVLFTTSKIHIVLHCRVQSCLVFTRLRFASPLLGSRRVSPCASSGTEETLGGAKGDHSKVGDGEFATRVHGWASRRSLLFDAERRGKRSHAERGDEVALAWAEKRPLGEKGLFFENVITDSHLLSFLGGRDCSNAVPGKEKRQSCRSRPGLVDREARFDRGTGGWPFASSTRRKALSWDGIRDWEGDGFCCIRLILSHFSRGKSICLEKVVTEHTPNLDF